MYEIVSIHTALISKIESKVAKLNKRAAKLKTNARIQISWGERKVESDDRGKVLSDVTECIVSGEAPKANGYILLATIRHLEAGDLFHGPEEIDASEFVNKGSFCEHCSTRRQRNETFILETPKGETMRVGRTCLGDFVRKDDAAAFVMYHNWLIEVASWRSPEDEDFMGGSTTGFHFSTRNYMALAARFIRTEGFKSSEYGYSESTRGACDDWISCSYSGNRESQLWAENNAPTPADYDMANEVIAWFAEIDCTNNFLINARTAVQNPVVNRTEGILAAAVSSYHKAVNAAKEARRAEENPKSNEHKGEKGERLTLSLEVVRTYTFETAYGDKTFVTMEDSEGNCYLWKGTSRIANKLETGDEVVGKGTVKGHDDYKGRKQTELTRCSFAIVI